MRSWKGAVLIAAAVVAAVVAAESAPAVHGAGCRGARSTCTRCAAQPRRRNRRVRSAMSSATTIPAETPSARGVQVEDVTPDGPAAKAGIQKGDVVVEFDGERVRSVRQFIRLVGETPPGRRVATAVVRGGQRKDLTVEPRARVAFASSARWTRRVPCATSAAVRRGIFLCSRATSATLLLLLPRPLQLLPPPPRLPRHRGGRTSRGFRGGTIARWGSGCRRSPTQLAEYFGAKQGVLVTSVEDNSAAHAAGFKAGDVVTALNGADVSDPADLRAHIQRLQDGDEFTVDVMRDKKALTLKGKMDRRTTRGAARVSL